MLSTATKLTAALVLRLAQPFSIQNYMKKFHPANLSRHHGRVRVDQYHTYFQDPNHVQEFVEQEKEHYEKVSRGWQSRSQHYYDRVTERKDIRNESTPEAYDEFEYRTVAAWHEGREYTKILRNRIGDPKEQEVLDIMKYQLIKQNYNTVQLTKTAFSPSHRYMAFGFDLLNNERTAFMVKDLERNQIVGVKGWEDNMLKETENVVFDGDEAIFFTKLAADFRPHEVWRQDLKTGEKQLIYQEKGGEYYVDIYLTKDNRHLIINSNSKEDNELISIALEDKPYQLKSLSQRSQSQKVHAHTCFDGFVLWKDTKDGHQLTFLRGETEKTIHECAA